MLNTLRSNIFFLLSIENILFIFLEDIAIDWVANNLYWTESVTNRIEVMDLDTLERTVLTDTGHNSIPRGIAVDPHVR